MKFIWAAASHQGRVRDNNEDSLYPRSSGRTDGRLLVAVADGMGGHVGGEIASELAIEAASASKDATPQERIEAANRLIMETVLEKPALAGMGTTLTLAELEPVGRVTLGHVGDSRAYMLRDGELRQVTTDHSVIAQYLESGQITEEEAKVHPQRGMLTRALGLGNDVEVDVSRERLLLGDRFMICSDGLNNMVDDARIQELLSEGTAEEAVWALVEAANAAGGFDNISVIVADFNQ